ncbi:MAG TPA: cyclic nucleotide-binding domain-containing protein, partial [Aggregatilineales bacterium]|nr:cyclic nucleotide-binding domain-containing protein [Aggregatilineales bacterium]
MIKHIAFLQESFPGLGEDSARELLSLVRESTYPTSTVLCREGAIEDVFYLIVDGQVAILKWMEFSGEERLLRYSEVGDFFGEMAIISDAPRGATVKTTRQTTVLEMDRESFL